MGRGVRPELNRKESGLPAFLSLASLSFREISDFRNRVFRFKLGSPKSGAFLAGNGISDLPESRFAHLGTSWDFSPEF